MNQLNGLVIVTASTILYALLYPLTKKLSQNLPPFTLMAGTMLVLFTLSVFASIFFENSLNLKAVNFKSNIHILILFGVINFLSFWLMILSYKYFPVWQVTMFSLLTPIVAGIFAYYLLGEKITVNLFIGLIIMSVGLYIAIRP